MTSLVMLVVTSFTAGLVAAIVAVQWEQGSVQPIGIVAAALAVSSVLSRVSDVVSDFRKTFDEGWDAAQDDDETPAPDDET